MYPLPTFVDWKFTFNSSLSAYFRLPCELCTHPNSHLRACLSAILHPKAPLLTYRRSGEREAGENEKQRKINCNDAWEERTAATHMIRIYRKLLFLSDNNRSTLRFLLPASNGFYFSFLKAYLMLIITFYRYSFAYAASHFHFNSRPPLLLLLPPHPSIASISVNCSHCGLRHSQFIKIASSVPGNKKRHQCVSSICLLESIFFFHCLRSSLSAAQTGKCGLWKVVHIFLVSARRAPINFKFLLAFNLLSKSLSQHKLLFCCEASLTHAEIGSPNEKHGPRKRGRNNPIIKAFMKMHWWMEGSARCWKHFLARLTLKSCAWVAGLRRAWEMCSWASGRNANEFACEERFSSRKAGAKCILGKKGSSCLRKVEFPPSGRNFNSNQKLLSKCQQSLCSAFLLINCVCLLLLLNYRPRQQAERQKRVVLTQAT